MSKVQTWKEVGRKERGLYLSPPGHGGQTFTYAAIVYEVTEARMENGRPVEYRTRTEDGAPLYERDAPHLSSWFKVLRVAMGEVAHAARALDVKKAPK